MRPAALALFASFSVCSIDAFGLECVAPPPLSQSDLNNDTKASVSAVSKLLGGAELDNNLGTKLRNVFIEHPETMQYYVVLVTYYSGCTLIRDSKTLTDSQKLEEFDKLKSQVLPQFSLPPAATTTAPAQPPTKPLGFTPRLHPNIVLVENNAAPQTDKTRAPTWAERYLRPVPFTFTVGNQYWVNVDYATSLAEGKAKLAKLKAANPSADFALYAPFGQNDKWNIVMASWVSKLEADQVLAAAKMINPTSFIWRACSKTVGNECVLTPKLKLAMHLRRKDKIDQPGRPDDE